MKMVLYIVSCNSQSTLNKSFIYTLETVLNRSFQTKTSFFERWAIEFFTDNIFCQVCVVTNFSNLISIANFFYYFFFQKVQISLAHFYI